MADDADIATENTDRATAELIRNRPRYQGHSAQFCIDCGADIEEARRKAITGVQTCLLCAEKRERRL